MPKIVKAKSPTLSEPGSDQLPADPPSTHGKKLISQPSHLKTKSAGLTEWHMLFGSLSVNTGKGVTLFDEYDNDLQYVASDTDNKFANDHGFDEFFGSLGNDYTAAIQAQVAELLENRALEGKSKLDIANLFNDLPTNIVGNKKRLGAASWVL